MTLEEFMKRNYSLRHAIQTGIKLEQEIGEDAGYYRNNPSAARVHKHDRVGINSNMV
jgi:hypothetical protein